MSQSIVDLISSLAKRQNIRLAADWAAELPNDLNLSDPHAMHRLAAALNWPEPQLLKRRPRADDFPLLIIGPTGWALAEQWDSSDIILAQAVDGEQKIEWTSKSSMLELHFPENAKQKNVRRAKEVFWTAILRRKRVLLDAVVATIVVNLLALATSLYSMQVYDRVIPRGGFSTLWVLTIGVGFALLVDFAMRIIRALMVSRESLSIDAEVSEFFFDRMQAVRLDARPPGIGSMAAQLRGIEQIRQLFSSASMFVMADLPFAILFLVVMAAIGGVVAIVPLVVFALSIVLALGVSRAIRAHADRTQISSNRKNGLLVEALDVSETIKANRGGWHMLASWNRLVDRVNSHELEVQRWSVLASQSFAFLQQAAYIGIVAWGAYRVHQGDMTMGGLIACTIISGRVNGPLVAALPAYVVQWGYARSSLMALDDLLAMPSDQPQDRPKIRPDVLGAVLAVKNATFSPGETRFGLSVPNLEINAGERVGIVGPVGAGKSTLLRLLAGLVPPQNGHVLLDGVSLDQIADDIIRREICYFPQDYRLISGTLRDNLTMGLPTVTDDVVMAAAAQTGLDDLIRTHPRGLDLPVFEGGGGMSGGQKAMVGLTRIALLKPAFLLMDEPTANLDQQNEARVMRALAQFSSSKTAIIIVSHRLTILNSLSRLIVMQRGRVVLDGNTASVLTRLRRGQAEAATAAEAVSALENKEKAK